MHELTGKIAHIAVDYMTGKPMVTFLINEKANAREMLDELNGAEKLSLKIGKFSKKRSKEANAYCWVLISELAAKLKIPKTEVYRNAIKEIGGNSDTVCIQTKAVESLCDGWSKNGLGWVTDTFPSKLDGCTNVILYYGSSTYDRSQMSRLINNIIQDCKALGIETKNQAEIDSLLQQWR